LKGVVSLDALIMFVLLFLLVLWLQNLAFSYLKSSEDFGRQVQCSGFAQQAGSEANAFYAASPSNDAYLNYSGEAVFLSGRKDVSVKKEAGSSSLVASVDGFDCYYDVVDGVYYDTDLKVFKE